MYWVSDIIFRDDEVSSDDAMLQNISIIKHMALNLLQKARGKGDPLSNWEKKQGVEMHSAP